MSILRHRAKVAGVIPAFLVNSLAGSLLVQVIPRHHICPLGYNLTSNVLRVATQNLHFHTVDGLATRTTHEVVIVAERDERCTLGGTITHGNGKVDGEQELFYFFRQGCTTHNNLVHLATESIDDLLTDAFLDLLVHNRHLQEQVHTVVLNLGEYFLTDNLFDNQWYSDDYSGFHFGKGFRDNRRTRQSRQEE